jgi:hypothetical protein
MSRRKKDDKVSYDSLDTALTELQKKPLELQQTSSSIAGAGSGKLFLLSVASA